MSTRLWFWLVLATAPFTPPARAEEKVVWQIGIFDHAAAEFHGRANAARITVDADAPDAAAKWPATQMGSLNAHAGGQVQTRTIRFRLAGEPRGVYTLDVSVLLGYPRTPYLQLKLNGTIGLIFPDRQLSYVSDFRSHNPVSSEARERIAIPASLLGAGVNELEITAMDDAPDENGDSVLAWDALRMLNDPDAASRREPQIAVEPTVFYTVKSGAMRGMPRETPREMSREMPRGTAREMPRETPRGTMREMPQEIVGMTVTLTDVVSRGELKLSLGGAEFRESLQAPRFGQQHFEFAVPEFAKDSIAKVSLSLDGNTLQREVRVSPQRKFTVYLVPHEHLDIGFTDYQPKVLEVQDLNIDRLLSEIRRNPDMRFSLDGSLVAEDYLRSRTRAAKQEFMRQVTAGKITIPAQYANLMDGTASLETLIQATTHGFALNHAAGIRVEYANSTDVPAFPWAYASVLHALGLKYFAAAGNTDRGPVAKYGRWQNQSPFWWEGPDGGKVLMAYTWQYSHLWFLCGLPPREAALRQSLPVYLEPFVSPSYRLDTILMYGSQAENTYLVPGEAEFVHQWNAHYAWPKLKLATFPEYFRAIEEKYGSTLETVKGDFGPYWEDGVGTDALYEAMQRRNENRALSAEALSSVAGLLSSEWAAPVERLRRMWDGIVLYAEHTYTSSRGYSEPDSEQSTRQLETKHGYAEQSREEEYWIVQQAFSRLLDRIHLPSPAVAVFNPLAHERSDLVEMDLQGGMQVIELPDERAVPLETVRTGSGYRHVRFLAAHVPPVGFRVYELKTGARRAVSPSQDLPATGVIENAFYRVRFKPEGGAISSIFDKQLGRELIDAASPYLANQFLYVSGGEDTRIVYSRNVLPVANLSISAASGGKVVRVRKTEWGQELVYTASARQAPSIETEIMLFDGEKKIEFVNRIRKDPSDNKEAVYFAFPFAMEKPEFSYEGQVGVVDPARDELAGGCREWYAVRHWARVEGSGISAAVLPVDAPLVTFGDINRGLWPTEFQPKSATIFSYPLNNYWHTNFQRVQAGDFTFRYLLTSGAQLSESALSRLGRDAMAPLETGELTRFDKADNPDRPLPPVPTSFIEIDSDHVELEALKTAEDGNGYILRLLETGGRADTIRLASSMLRFESATLCNAAEEAGRALAAQGNAIEIPVKPFGIVTLRLRMSLSRQ